MIHYFTTTHPSIDWKDIQRQANQFHLEVGSGSSRLILEPEHATPKQQASWAEGLIVQELDLHPSFALVVAATLEMPVLRICRNIREGLFPSERFQVHCLTIDSCGKKRADILKADQEGEFTRLWPDGFFDERMAELY